MEQRNPRRSSILKCRNSIGPGDQTKVIEIFSDDNVNKTRDLIRKRVSFSANPQIRTLNDTPPEIGANETAVGEVEMEETICEPSTVGAFIDVPSEIDANKTDFGQVEMDETICGPSTVGAVNETCPEIDTNKTAFGEVEMEETICVPSTVWALNETHPEIDANKTAFGEVEMEETICGPSTVGALNDVPPEIDANKTAFGEVEMEETMCRPSTVRAFIDVPPEIDANKTAFGEVEMEETMCRPSTVGALNETHPEIDANKTAFGEVEMEETICGPSTVGAFIDVPPEIDANKTAFGEVEMEETMCRPSTVGALNDVPPEIDENGTTFGEVEMEETICVPSTVWALNETHPEIDTNKTAFGEVEICVPSTVGKSFDDATIRHQNQNKPVISVSYGDCNRHYNINTNLTKDAKFLLRNPLVTNSLPQQRSHPPSVHYGQFASSKTPHRPGPKLLLGNSMMLKSAKPILVDSEVQTSPFCGAGRRMQDAVTETGTSFNVEAEKGILEITNSIHSSNDVTETEKSFNVEAEKGILEITNSIHSSNDVTETGKLFNVEAEKGILEITNSIHSSNDVTETGKSFNVVAEKGILEITNPIHSSSEDESCDNDDDEKLPLGPNTSYYLRCFEVLRGMGKTAALESVLNELLELNAIEFEKTLRYLDGFVCRNAFTKSYLRNVREHYEVKALDEKPLQEQWKYNSIFKDELEKLYGPKKEFEKPSAALIQKLLNYKVSV